jgi:hypothetical protein
MRLNQLAAAILTVSMFSGAARAAHIWEDPELWWSSLWVYEQNDEPKFAAHEFSLELYGGFLAPERGIEHVFETDIRDDGTWGGGVGLSYFLTREIGLGVDASTHANGGTFFDQVLGNLILRLPWERASLAPYLIGGGGRSYDPVEEWVAHGGLGIEWRPNAVTGIFFDTRYVWADDSTDRIAFRAGLRLIF